MMLFWTSPLGPVLWLLLGVLLLSLGAKLFPQPLRERAPAWWVALALLFWLLLRLWPAQPAVYWLWRSALGIDATLGMRLDGWSWLAGMGILLITLAATALPGWGMRAGFTDPRLWALLLAATGLLVVIAHTWIWLLIAWGVLVVALGLAAGPAEAAARGWSVGILATFLLLAAALFNGSNTLEFVLDGATLNLQAQLLLALAAFLFLGVYPLHLWLAVDSWRGPGRQLILHLTPGLAALHLLGRFNLTLLTTQALVVMGVVALLGSALAAWAERDDAQVWIWVLVNRSTWAALVLALTPLPAPVGAIFPLVTLMLGGVMWAMARVTHWQFRWSLPYWLSVALLFGFPFTPGFATGLAFRQLAGSLVGFPGWLLVLLSQSLILAALIRRRPSPPDEPGLDSRLEMRALALALALVGMFSLWWGFFPQALLRTAGLTPSGPYVHLPALLFGAGPVGWLTFLLPLAGGIFLARRDEWLFGRFRGWQQNIAQIASFGWAVSGFNRFGVGLTHILDFISDLLDGAGQFGWVLLAILLGWLLLGS